MNAVRLGAPAPGPAGGQGTVRQSPSLVLSRLYLTCIVRTYHSAAALPPGAPPLTIVLPAMTHRITIERNTLSFSAAHFTTFRRDCHPLHGHNYAVFVELEGDLTSD